MTDLKNHVYKFLATMAGEGGDAYSVDEIAHNLPHNPATNQAYSRPAVSAVLMKLVYEGKAERRFLNKKYWYRLYVAEKPIPPKQLNIIQRFINWVLRR